MAWKMHVSLSYGTHLPCLIKALEKTNGDILELGLGVFSTPYLHYFAMLNKRKLVSYENFKGWYKFFAVTHKYGNQNHELFLIDDYKDAPIEKEWDVVLVDQTPDESRIETVRRLVDRAKYIIIHDSTPRHDSTYHYSEIYPLFKYKSVWDIDDNHATILSNSEPLEDFWK